MYLHRKIKVTLKERANAPSLSFSKPSHKPTKKAFTVKIKDIARSLKYKKNLPWEIYWKLALILSSLTCLKFSIKYF